MKFAAYRYALVSALLAFAACSPLKPNATGELVGFAEAQTLDQHLSESLAAKQSIERTAAKFKARFPPGGAEIDAAQVKYERACSEMNNLRADLKVALQSSSSGNSVNKASQETIDAQKRFISACGDFNAYYAKVTDTFVAGSTLSDGFALLNSLLQSWTDFDDARRQALTAGIDARLTSKPWNTIPSL